MLKKNEAGEKREKKKSGRAGEGAGVKLMKETPCEGEHWLVIGGGITSKNGNRILLRGEDQKKRKRDVNKSHKRAGPGDAERHKDENKESGGSAHRRGGYLEQRGWGSQGGKGEG